jgi:hypothetical protein
MSEKYVLLGSFERDIDTPIIYNTLDEARSAMKDTLISAMDGKDESIFAEYKKDEDYDWEPDSNGAWFNHRHGNRDWAIVELGEILALSTLKQKNDESERSTAPRTKPLTVMFTIDLTQENIDDIMCSALECGISYWCSEAEVVGDYLGEYAHEQISRGGTLLLHDSESNEKFELTQDNFLKGLRLFLSGGHSDLVNIKNNSIDPGDFDGNCADMVVQLGLFGKIVYA